MKKFLAILCALALCLMCATAMAEGESHPKYVFMFIGDGMGNPQVTATQYYLGSIENPDSKFPVPADLSFTKFPYLGLVTTYDSSSFCPDSASTATSMASGKKTLSGVINYDETLTNPYKIITEYAKEAGKKVGVITSVSVDHATPAAYYAKQPSRNDYYDIALQALTGTTVDYLAGGGFKKMNGADGQQKSLLDVAKENGWVIPTTNDEIRSLIATNDRVLATNPVLQDSKAIHYEIDRIQKEAAGEDVLSLADFVRSGINVLDNDNGFFMMCEGGKIDWACHANDAGSTVADTVALADAVQVSTVYTDTYTPIRAMVTLYALYSWQDGETTRYTTQPQNKVCPSEAFSDLDVTQWYHEPVDYMLETGMMNGMSATTFEPNGTLTRAQLVTVLYRHAGSPDVTGLPNPFADVAPQSWYAKAVIWAAANGVVKGTSAATFAPEDAITREQIAAILYRYNGEAVTEDRLSSFPDADAVSGYAVEAMQWAVSRGLISGDPASDGTLWLRPRDGATRAQIAKILWVWLGA